MRVLRAGFARERSELLAFITDQGIANVVFVSADMHVTLFAPLVFQRPAEVSAIVKAGFPPFAAPQHFSGAFHVTTGAVAVNFGARGAETVELAFQSGIITEQEKNLYDQLPTAELKDSFVQTLLNTFVTSFGYPPMGLRPYFNVTDTVGAGRDYLGHTFQWTEFDVEPATHKLTLTTFGVPSYCLCTSQNVNATPSILRQFSLMPN
jgi:hypothetical protein